MFSYFAGAQNNSEKFFPAKDLTTVGTAGAFEAIKMVLDSSQIKALKTRRNLFLTIVPGQQGYADSPHDFIMRRHNDGAPQGLFESPGHSLIGGHPALEQNGFPDLLAFKKIIQIIADQGLTEARYNILSGVSHLLFVDHVRLGKDRAPTGDFGRFSGLQG